MLNFIGFSLLSMNSVANRGLLYTFFILNFVLVCQLILLQPLVSASGKSLIRFYQFNCFFCFITLMLRSEVVFVDRVFFLKK